ncbi:MAG: hypothetical protein WA971_03285, partial [Microbacterium sp.]
MIATLFAQEFRATRKNLFGTVGILALMLAVSFVLVALRIPVLGAIAFYLSILLVVLITPLVLVL